MKITYDENQLNAAAKFIFENNINAKRAFGKINGKLKTSKN